METLAGDPRGRTIEPLKFQGITHSSSISCNETHLPVYDWRTQVSSVESYSQQELQLLWQQQLAVLQPGNCIAFAAGRGVAHLVFPLPADPVKQLGDKILARLRHFVAELLKSPLYLNPHEIDGHYDRLVDSIRPQPRRSKGANNDDTDNDPFVR